MRRFIRTCQICFHKQEAKDPATYKSDIWKDLKCRKCKQDQLDYGSWQGHDTKPWRDKFKAITGQDLIIPEAKLDELIDGDECGYLADDDEGRAFLNILKEANK